MAAPFADARRHARRRDREPRIHSRRTDRAAICRAGFVPVRKPGKLPSQRRREEYALEYGTDVLEIHADAVDQTSRVLIVDDVLATGGTAAATCRLVESLGATVIGLSFLDRAEFPSWPRAARDAVRSFRRDLLSRRRKTFLPPNASTPQKSDGSGPRRHRARHRARRRGARRRPQDEAGRRHVREPREDGDRAGRLSHDRARHREHARSQTSRTRGREGAAVLRDRDDVRAGDRARRREHPQAGAGARRVGAGKERHLDLRHAGKVDDASPTS